MGYQVEEDALPAGRMLFSSDADFEIEPSQKAKLFIYQLVCVPPLVCGHKLLAATERMRSRLQAARGEEGEEDAWLLCSGPCTAK